MLRIDNGRKEFFQWDLNQQLIVDDESIKQVHFNNGLYDNALVCLVEDGKVNVPNILLQDDWDLKVYAYKPDYTKEEYVFNVVSRSKPSDYEYTETEILNWDAIEKKVDEAIANTGYYVPNVDVLGDLTWTPSKSTLPTPDTSNIKGPRGDVGPIGPQGPKGDVGPQGPIGPVGPQAETDDAFNPDSTNALQNKVIAQNVAPALVNLASGMIIGLNDVSAIPHNASATLESKNLIENDWEIGTISTVNGANATTSKFIRSKNFNHVNYTNDNYTITCSKSYSVKHIYCYDQNKEYIGFIWSNRQNPFKLKLLNGTSYLRVVFEQNPYTDLNLTEEDIKEANDNAHYLMEKGSVATPYTKHVDLMKAISSKNIVNYKTATTRYGTIDFAPDTLTWTDAKYLFILDCNIEKGTEVVFSCVSTKIDGVRYVNEAGKESSPISLNTPYTTTEKITKINVYKINPNKVETVEAKNIQLELGSTATAYVPYTEPKPAQLLVQGKNLINADLTRNYVDIKLPSGEYSLSIGSLLNGTKFRYQYQTYKNGVNVSDQVGSYPGIFYNTGFKCMLSGQDNTNNAPILIKHIGDLLKVRINFGDLSAKSKTTQTQLEAGQVVTEYEDPKPVVNYPVNADGTVDNIKLYDPDSTLMANVNGINVDATYNADLKRYVDNKFQHPANTTLIMGGNTNV